MKQISRSPVFLKYTGLTASLSLITFSLLWPFLPGSEEFPPIVQPFYILIASAVFLFFKKEVWNIADRVYDNDDELIFQRGRKEQRVKLCDITNIRYSSYTFNAPRRIIVYARSRGAIGKKLAFRPPIHFIPFVQNPMVQELVERVDRVKNRLE